VITFKQYLEEASNVQQKWAQKPLTTKAAVAMIEKHCSDSLAAFLKGDGIFRGFGGSAKGDAMYIDSSGSFRTSKDSNNLYQLAHDASTHSMHIPSRSNSLICTTDHGTADSYAKGHAYAIFPYNGTPVGISDDADFFGQSVNSVLLGSHSSVTEVTDYLTDIMTAFGLKKTKYDDIDVLDAKLAEIDTQRFAFFAAIKASPIDYMEPSDIIVGVTDKGKNTLRGAIDLGRYNNIQYRSTDGDKKRAEIFALVKSGDYAYTKKFATILKIAGALNSKKRFTEMSALLFTKSSPGGKVAMPGSPALRARDKECWFSGECIAVSMGLGVLRQMRDELKAKGYKKLGTHLSIWD
jgi:hypothetical protein